jgi:integrase/recombinase XerC
MASVSFELLEECLASMKARGKSVQSVRDMRNSVGRGIRYLESNGLDVLSFARSDAITYQGFLLDEGLCARTVKGYMVALSSFCDFLEEEGYRYDNPARAIHRPACERTVPWGLPDEKTMEVFLDRLADIERKRTRKDRKVAFRTLVMAELQYASGLRLEEVADLVPADLDLAHETVIVRQGKGNKARRAFLTSYSVELLELWLEVRESVLQSNSDHSRLFGASAATLSHTYNRELNTVARGVGLPGWSSHGFRHALGYHLLRAGCDIRRIKDILGHSRISTTEIYTEVNREDLRSVIDTYHPRAS